MTEHPSLKRMVKTSEFLEEELKIKIAELQSETLEREERLKKIVELEQKFRELQKCKEELRLKEDQELDSLEKKALELLIKKLER